MWHIAHLGEIRCAYKTSVRRPKWKRPLAIPRKRREDNIKMDLK
jgi:hypothetical protein